MTIDEGIDMADTLLRLRREVAGIARGVDVTSPTFIVEWRAALAEVHARLELLAHYEQQLDPILRPPGVEPFTLEQYRAWLVRMTRIDEDGHPAPTTAPSRVLHPSVH